MESKERREELQQATLEQLREIVTAKLDSYVATNNEDKTGPILKALFEHAPNDTGKKNMGVEIASCATPDCLKTLSERYKIGLVQSVRAAGGKTPVISDHPSQPAANIGDVANYLLMQSNHRSRASLRAAVILRDNYRCVVSGYCDYESVNKGKLARGDAAVCILQAAHILPYSLVPESVESHDTVKRAGMVWEVIEAFSGICLEELNGPKINRPENCIALNEVIHKEFGALNLILEATEIANTYNVTTPGGNMETIKSLFGGTVTFTNRGGIPVPDPRFLALHAACAKVLHQSGMAEILDKLDRELEKVEGLRHDGSSAHLLQYRLTAIAVQ